MSDELQAARERRADRQLDEMIDEAFGVLFSEADTVGPGQRHQLRGILRHYAKMAHPFRACVRDNMKRFGPGRTEKVCATLKDIIRGTTKWRGHPGLDHGAPGAVAASIEIDDDLAKVLLSIPEEKIDRLDLALQEQRDSILFAIPAAEIVTDSEQPLAETPPPEADYRPAEIEAVACWNCAHFERTGLGDDNWPTGACHLWEAKVQGEAVCDRFTVDQDQSEGTLSASETESGFFEAAELYQPGSAVEFADDDGFIVKEIMRTGEWGKTPGSKGVVQKKLQVVRDGESDPKEGIIALSELVDSFDKGAYQYVTIPLSDDEKDHKNLTNLNTGFVKKLFIEDLPNGVSKLKAKLHITEPDVRERVERGTIPDVSAGIYFNVERPDGEKFKSALNHVCLTIKPFMDGLNPFGSAVLAANEDAGEQPEKIETFIPPETPPTEESKWDDRLSFSWQRDQIRSALTNSLQLSSDYDVIDIANEKAIVTNKVAETSWMVPFSRTGDGIAVATTDLWEVREEESDSGSEEPEESAAAPADKRVVLLEGDELQQARQVRALRAGISDNSEGGEDMGRANTDPLAGIDLSDEEAVRAAFAQQAEETQRLRERSRTGEVDQEIERVKGLGFENSPGFLATLRDILLSDDEEPAMVLFSHDDQGNQKAGTKEMLTATEVAKRLIDALPTEDGKVLLAQQHLSSGNNEPPPEKDEDAEVPVQQRTAEAAEAIGLGAHFSDSGKE